MNYIERKKMIEKFNALQIQAVAFDFDGVLADSVAIKDGALEDLVESTAKGKGKQARELWKRTRGIFRRDRIALIYNNILGIDLGDEALDRTVQHYKESVFQATLSAPPIAGSLDYLQSWPLIPSYVVSAAPQEEVVEIVHGRGINKYFRGVFGGPVKKEDILTELVRREQCQARELLFIGDSDSDHRAAVAVGTAFLGVVAEGCSNPFASDVRTIPDLRGLARIVAGWWEGSVS